jgi:hypothetical protein
MIAAPKGQRFIESFVGQWLSLRLLDHHYVDKGRFPRYDDELVEAMKRETELYFGEFLRRPLPVSQLFTAEFTYLNDRLAQHYGLPAPGSGFQRVALTTPQRGGILGQASVLVATSHADRTGVVKRGQWVLSQLLCTDPPPPPPGIPPLPSAQQSEGSQRERLEDHRTERSCSACHKIMDPIGFGLENYDAVGVWRSRDGKYDIDASGQLPGGIAFDGPRALGRLLGRDPRFSRCLARRLYTFALGRPPAATDEWFVDQMLRPRGAELTMSDLISNLVGGEPFRFRRREP